MSAVSAVFERCRAENRAALIGYLPAGFPSYEGSVAACTAMVEAGVDIVEVGLPYSDPLMDGPVIQAAVDRALHAGTRTKDVISLVQAVAGTGAAAVVMTYWNPVERHGVDAFAREVAAAGGAGVITPDLIPEEAGEWLTAARTHDLDPIFLVAPSSTDERLHVVADTSRGFVYVASTMGVTGARESVSNRAGELVGRMRAVTDLPLAVGLGVSTKAQAAEVAGYADGVIVGSALVRCLLDAETEAAGIDALRGLVAELAAGVRTGR